MLYSKMIAFGIRSQNTHNYLNLTDTYLVIRQDESNQETVVIK